MHTLPVSKGGIQKVRSPRGRGVGQKRKKRTRGKLSPLCTFAFQKIVCFFFLLQQLFAFCLVLAFNFTYVYLSMFFSTLLQEGEGGQSKKF